MTIGLPMREAAGELENELAAFSATRTEAAR
jgi:hypothetical protein